jgi:predicted ATPase/DNA-binding SARP family transcriptional activator/DNA-binding CsgD family transcriptional regulator
VPEAVRVRLLGDFRVSVGNRTIEEDEWRLRKAGSLIKLLALAPQHRLHREQVMDLLWPKLDVGKADNNLRYTLHNARRTLESALPNGSRCLHLRNGRLALCPEGLLWVDVEAFEEAAAAARRARNPAAYEAAVGLYAGDLLPEDSYEEWAEDRREELRRTYLALLLELAGLYEKGEDSGSAVEALRQVLASEPTHEGAHMGLMRLYALSGQHQGALRQYGRLREALSRKLGAEPGAASRCLYEEILAGRFSPADPSPAAPSPEEPAGASQHNLPAARTSFVGRERELVEVKRALTMTRLLTLTGACGSGKTRLALEVAEDLTEAYSDGVWLTELATLSEGALVPQAVAATLGVREQPDRPLTATLVDVLRKKKMLLVLDNCEHLVDAAAHLVDTLLSSCPHLRVLATSREALSVAGEAKWPVPPFSLPDSRQPPTVEDLAGFESVRLFLERARSHHPAFVLTPRNVGAVADICRQLEGIPLAIELVAAWVGVLSVGQIATRLKDPLKILTAGSRTAPPRQQTQRGALGWSYDLLSEAERRLFNRLSVFAGGWTLEAAEAVGTGDGIDEDDVLELLSRLVNKSLAVAEANGDGALRYRMLELVRLYGLERLEASGEAEPIRRQHAAWFLELAEEAEPGLKGAQQEAWLERLEREHVNLRVALSWSLERGETGPGLRLSGALGEFWHLRGHLSEGRRWLEATLAKDGVLPGPARAKALARAGCIAWVQGDYERSMALSEESLTLWRELGDMAGAAAALSNLGWAALFQNQLERASTRAEEAVPLQRASGDMEGLARTLPIPGLAAAAQHDYEQAAALHEESLALARKVEDNFAIILSLALGAFVSLGLGDYGRVRDLCAEGLELSRQLKMRYLTATHLHISATVAGSQGQPVHSARLWGAAEALREAVGTIFSPLDRHFYEPYIAAARTQLDKAAWEAAWAEGRAMTFEAMIEYALSEERRAPTTTSTPEEPPAGGQQTLLTRREREVAALVGRGLTNRQISAELVLSEHTVATHVCKILKKLGLHSRAQIAAWVAEQPLLPSNSD